MAMRSDLKGLRISLAQVESLTQVRVGWLLRPISGRRFWDRIWGFSAFWDPLRILRQNQAFIENTSELFASNRATLTALQVSEQASEQGRLLETALQIALDVRAEMRKLQERA
ncbi:MAG: hypothetical protein Q6M04_10385 [Thermostichus sp. BF3_bins_97]